MRAGRPADARKQAAILRNARRMFTTLGFAGSSMDQLADASDVAKATIYLHFGSKRRLFETVLRSLLRQLPTPAQLVGSAADGPLAPRLATIAGDACKLATSPLMRDVQRMLALPMAGAGRSKGEFWRECLAPYQQAFANLLREEATAGNLDIPDAGIASSHFFNLVAGEAFIRTLLGDAPSPPAEAKVRVDAAVAAFLRAYGK